MSTLKDIENREDIMLLVQVLYDKLLKDDSMSLYFNDLKLDDHFEVLCDFWENALFQAGKYSGDMLGKHLAVHADHKIDQKVMDIWLGHFQSSLDVLYRGEMADLAMNKAKTLGVIIMAKINRLDRLRLELNN